MYIKVDCIYWGESGPLDDMIHSMINHVTEYVSISFAFTNPLGVSKFRFIYVYMCVYIYSNHIINFILYPTCENHKYTLLLSLLFVFIYLYLLYIHSYLEFSASSSVEIDDV